MCNYCKEKRHWKIKCLKLKKYPKKKEKSDKEEASSSIAQVDVDFEEVDIDSEGDLALTVNQH